MYSLRNYIHKEDRINCHLLVDDVIKSDERINLTTIAEKIPHMGNLSHEKKIDIIDAMALRGDLEMVKLLKKHKFPLSRSTFHYAVMSGNDELRSWLLEKGCPFAIRDFARRLFTGFQREDTLSKTRDVLHECGKKKSIGPLRRALAKKESIDKFAMFAEYAALSGSIKDLEFLKKHRFDMDSGLFTSALKNNHFHVVDWGLENNVHYDFDHLQYYFHKDLKMAKYIFEKFDEHHSQSAMNPRYLYATASPEVVVWFRETGRITDRDICMFASNPDTLDLVENCNYDDINKRFMTNPSTRLLRWLESKGKLNITNPERLPLHIIVKITDLLLQESLIEKAIKCSDIYYVKLLHQRGCPWPENCYEMAATNNCINMLKYMKKIGKAYNKENLLKTPNLHVMVYQWIDAHL